jgi:hypothetical protein
MFLVSAIRSAELIHVYLITHSILGEYVMKLFIIFGKIMKQIKMGVSHEY